MTNSSRDVRNEVSDPLRESRPAPTPGVGWKPVLAFLIAFPFLFALLLSHWLGTPQEQTDGSELFARLGVSQVPVDRLYGLAYGQMYFARIELSGESRTSFLRSLGNFDVRHGKPETPISFKLERSWWDPPLQDSGTYWTRQRALTVWNPDSRPELFYTVVVLEERH